jgi:RNA polymerase-binding protein DksA
MDEKKRQEFRRVLEDMLKRLTPEIDSMIDAVRDEYQVPGEHDAKPSLAVDKQVHLEQNEEALFTAIREALDRIDAGTFGRCQQCGREIAAQRLRAVPYAAHCIECQEWIEAGASASATP